MKVRIGTINELKGEGIEYLVDRPTRSIVLAKFFNGWMVRQALNVNVEDDTIVLKEESITNISDQLVKQSQ